MDELALERMGEIGNEVLRRKLSLGWKEKQILRQTQMSFYKTLYLSVLLKNNGKILELKRFVKKRNEA